MAPGAIIAAVIWQLLQLFDTAYVASVVKDASATDGVFALVLGLLAWIFVAALGDADDVGVAIHTAVAPNGRLHAYATHPG